VKEDPYWPSKQELISYFNKAISPYGYPNYQKICHKAAVIVGTAHFCFETLNKVMPDESTGKVLVKSISFDQKMLTAPVLYITDSLGEALFQTKAPDSVEVSKKFYNEFLVKSVQENKLGMDSFQ
jgi:hypothetical protein